MFKKPIVHYPCSNKVCIQCFCAYKNTTKLLQAFPEIPPVVMSLWQCVLSVLDAHAWKFVGHSVSVLDAKIVTVSNAIKLKIKRQFWSWYFMSNKNINQSVAVIWIFHFSYTSSVTMNVFMLFRVFIIPWQTMQVGGRIMLLDLGCHIYVLTNEILQNFYNST